MGRTVDPTSGKQREESFPQVPAQLVLPLDPTLVDQHRSLKECVAARMYQQRGGITAVAGKLDMSPSHLCEVLAGGGDRHRKMDLDEFEAYISHYNDVAPVLYLVAKYMPAIEHQQAIAVQELKKMREQIDGMLGSFDPPKRGRPR